MQNHQRKFMILILFINWFFVFPAFAVVVSNLTTVTMPISSQNEQGLQQVLPNAISEALVRLSGNLSVMTLPQMQAVLSNANKYMQSYSFFKKNSTNGKNAEYVKIQFDQQALIHLLHQAGQAIWRNDRPLVLVWLQTISAQGEINVLSDNESDLYQNLKRDAKYRGVPILLPSMDLQDQNNINTNLNHDFDFDKLKAIKQRYQVNDILAGNLYMTDQGVWQAKWLFLFNGQSFQWRTTATNQKQNIEQAINRVADLLANALSTLDNKNLQASINLQVQNVMDLSAYVKVIRYLKSLDAVASVRLMDMDNANIVLNVSIVGGAQALVDALQDSRYLQALPLAETENRVNQQRLIDFTYRLKTKWHPMTSQAMTNPHS